MLSNVIAVLLSSFMAAFIFSIFGAQPLCIAGVTGTSTRPQVRNSADLLIQVQLLSSIKQYSLSLQESLILPSISTLLAGYIYGARSCTLLLQYSMVRGSRLGSANQS